MNILFRLLGSLVMMVAATQVLAAGNSEAGQARAVVCAACHGAEGTSISPDFPNLAAQVPGYIADQLRAFKSGGRVNALMVGQVAALSEQDMLDLDTFYSTREAAQSAVTLADIKAISGAEDKESLARGEKLYRGGDAKRSIAACMACHGPGGHGIPVQYPRIAGQHAKYLKSQLLAFKSGSRQDASNIMTSLAFRLSEQEISDLSLFLQGLQ